MKRLSTFPLHPFLFAIYPVLALLGHNIAEIRAAVALRPLLVSLLLSAGVLLIFRLLFNEWSRAAIATSTVLVLFFAYGHVYNYLKGLTLAGFVLDRHRYLFPLVVALLLGMLVWLARARQEWRNWHAFLNLVGVTLLIFPLFQLADFSIRTWSANPEVAAPDLATDELHLPIDAPAPDVYYFILDAYSRDDTLLSEYDLDNQAFLEQLRELGFYLASCSQSNYAQTQLSLASSLNLNYLEAIDPRYSAGNTDRTGLPELIKHGRIRQIFASLGYQVVAFETGFKITEWEDADFYLSPASAAVGNLQVSAGLNDFELMLVNTSAGRILTDAAVKLPAFLQDDFENPRRIHRQRILYALDQLRSMPALPGPKFVFAHLVIPHPPYVFGAQGEFIDYDRDPRAAYRDQVLYLNQQLIPLIESIQQASETPPVIVLQGDHGGVESTQAFRMEILNAYYLPGGGESRLYESISPVNSFRVILNHYFGAHYEILSDTSYFSVYNAPFDYTVIPNKRPGCP